jgi:hypothetical protein
MMGTFIMAGLNRLLGNTPMAVAFCATGRALDFATTWVGVEGHRAVEAKPFAAGIFELVGTVPGLITYEMLVTTPVIFLGCRLANRIQARQKAPPQRLPMNSPLLYSIGIISTIVAVHNLNYLF